MIGRIELDPLSDKFHGDLLVPEGRTLECVGACRSGRCGVCYLRKIQQVLKLLTNPARSASMLWQPAEQSIYSVGIGISCNRTDYAHSYCSIARLVARREINTPRDWIRVGVRRFYGGGEYESIVDLVDTIEIFCQPLPMTGICEILGVDLVDWAQLQGTWSKIFIVNEGSQGDLTMPTRSHHTGVDQNGDNSRASQSMVTLQCRSRS